VFQKPAGYSSSAVFCLLPSQNDSDDPGGTIWRPLLRRFRRDLELLSSAFPIMPSSIASRFPRYAKLPPCGTSAGLYESGMEEISGSRCSTAASAWIFHQ